MIGIAPGHEPARPRQRAWAAGLTLALVFAGLPPASAATTGKLQGRVVATDSGEPLGFADVLLIPADTTMKRVGGMTNADGTFLLEAAPGRYALQMRALSYASKRIEGIVLEAGALLPFGAALTPEAIQQKEIVVEARARQNTETSMLAARRKSASLTDAVSSEQMRRSPDKDAAEVLRRVTGLSVSDGKYVFVRGLGERYSSTEVDGVRVASPEQNKRVVALDLLPANLLENIVVQKTYTADRPGEFGGGDVQVRTKDFPGARMWSFSIAQGDADGTTFRGRQTYASTRADLFGFGADARKIPDPITMLAPDRKLDPRKTPASIGKSFSNVWSPTSSRTIPNAGYSASFGDEFKLFGRPLGLIESWSLSRSFDHQDERQQLFQGTFDHPIYDYAVSRFKESVQLGGVSGLSYRLSPRHSLHLRGLYTNSADDEVRIYQGPDFNLVEPLTGGPLIHRNTRLMYVQRNILSGTVEGKNEFSHLLGASLDWRFTRSRARRRQPDRRETTYDYRYDDVDASGNGIGGHWAIGSLGRREFGDLLENGWGTTASGAAPYRLGPLGSGKVVLGVDRQSKERRDSYRRFDFAIPDDSYGSSAPPEQIFDHTTVAESTLPDDNYRASQRVTAWFVSVDLPFGRRARGNLGIRKERGFQDVRSFSFETRTPARVTSKGELDNADWLPSGNLTFEIAKALNLRLAASRTLSRPDLNELSPRPFLEYVGGMRIQGNPLLKRALIDNYDVRFEAFPALSEVLAAGFFYKRLHQPIEQVITADTPLDLTPENSGLGHNAGVELEARAGLGRLWRGLKRFSLNTNASFISSEVRLNPLITSTGSQRHPLQGQADYLVNAALSYAAAGGRTDMAILLGAVGRRLRALGPYVLPDIYEQPSTSLDATMNFTLLRRSRVKLSAKNLLDPKIQELQRGKEVLGYRTGRSFSVALSYGS